MSRQSDALLKLRILGAPIDHQTPAQRIQLIARINQVAQQEHVRKTRMRHAFWLSSAAALLMTFGGWAMWPEVLSPELVFQQTKATGAHATRQSAEQATLAQPTRTRENSKNKAQGLSEPGAREPGGRKQEGETRLASGTQLRAAAGSAYEVKVSQRDGHSDESILLETGLLQLKVPALGQETVSVKTPDALVLVHGTEFSVQVLVHDGQSSTRVKVTEGLVSVRSGHSHEYLRPGASWSSARPTGDDALAPQRTPAAFKSVPTSTAPILTETPSTDSGTLALENAIYARAMKFKLAGEYSAARQALEELIENYPSSPLVPSAEKAQAKFRELEAQAQQ